jgi:hypothetical protein
MRGPIYVPLHDLLRVLELELVVPWSKTIEQSIALTERAGSISQAILCLSNTLMELHAEIA